MQIDLPAPDFPTLCRRAQALKAVPSMGLTGGPMTLIVDSTGLRVPGGRDWMAQKHGLPNAWKTWRKLHIGRDPERGQIVASCLLSLGRCMMAPERPEESKMEKCYVGLDVSKAETSISICDANGTKVLAVKRVTVPDVFSACSRAGHN